MNRAEGCMMQCSKGYVAVTVHNLVLAELWLKLVSCQLVGLSAMSIKQQITGSKGESNIVVPGDT